MDTKLIFLCGKVGSGKTTVAKDLSRRYQAIVFNADQWMTELFGEELTRPVHEEKLAKVKAIVFGLTKELLDRGVSVLLDFGFWTRYERDTIRKLFEGYELKMVYIPVSDEVQSERVLLRNQSLEKTYTIPLEMLKELNTFFEEPDETQEDYEVINL